MNNGDYLEISNAFGVVASAIRKKGTELGEEDFRESVDLVRDVLQEAVTGLQSEVEDRSCKAKEILGIVESEVAGLKGTLSLLDELRKNPKRGYWRDETQKLPEFLNRVGAIYDPCY